MNKIPSVLQSILRKRYLSEAVTVAPQVSYTKKKEEETVPVPKFAPSQPTVAPEIKTPSIGEFPDVTKAEKAIEAAKSRYQFSPLSKMDPMAAYKEIPTTPSEGGARIADIIDKLTKLEILRDFEEVEKKAEKPEAIGEKVPGRSIRDVARRSQESRANDAIGRELRKQYGPRIEKGVLDLSTVPEQVKRLEDLTRKGKQATIEYGKGLIPDVKQTARATPGMVTQFGLSMIPAYYGAEFGEQLTNLENDPILNLDPVSATTMTVAAAGATPYMYEVPMALARGAGLAGSLSQGAAAASAALMSPWTTIPPILYAGMYGMSKAEEAAEPYRQKKAQEIDSLLRYERAKRAAENRKPSFWEKYSEEELERSKFYPLGAADWGR